MRKGLLTLEKTNDMIQIDKILEKEQTNMDRIFVYVLHGRFMALGYSAYYVALLCPKLEITWSRTDASDPFVCICIPEDCLHSFSPKYPTLVDDENICIAPPLNICRQRDSFAQWQERQLHFSPEIDIEQTNNQ